MSWKSKSRNGSRVNSPQDVCFSDAGMFRSRAVTVARPTRSAGWLLMSGALLGIRARAFKWL
jgi:hypothetical protein